MKQERREGNAKGEFWASEIATKCDNLILIPGTHMVGENQQLQVVL